MLVDKFVVSAMALAICCACSAGGPAAAQRAPAVAPADAQTTRIVAAANAYLASLTPAQKQASMFAYGDAAQRVLWSNFPNGIVQRKGVTWGELNAGQRAKLITLLSAVLSPEGVKMVREQMDADQYLKEHPDQNAFAGGPGRGARPPGGPPPGGGAGPPPGGRPPGGGLLFGSDLYYTAFLGTPSATTPWMLQFGGHHLAINATVIGGNMTITPSLTGGQPVKFDKNGKEIYIVEHEVREAQALIDSLNPAQKAKAVLGTSAIDLILGPGHDGQVLQPEGLIANEMTADQKATLMSLIEARVGIVNADDADAAIAKIRANLDKTYFAWFGPTSEAGGAYFRVTGPTVVLEFSPQDVKSGGVSNHLHNMYRDPTNDYGAAWASLK
jgi:hypothetical protein